MTFSDGKDGWSSGGGACSGFSTSVAGMVSRMCFINCRSCVYSFPPPLVWCATCCPNLIAKDLLTFDNLFLICWRCVIVEGLSRMYKYKFCAVFESWMYTLG